MSRGKSVNTGKSAYRIFTLYCTLCHYLNIPIRTLRFFSSLFSSSDRTGPTKESWSSIKHVVKVTLHLFGSFFLSSSRVHLPTCLTDLSIKVLTISSSLHLLSFSILSSFPSSSLPFLLLLFVYLLFPCILIHQSVLVFMSQCFVFICSLLCTLKC